ncbi:hypothetical protein EDD18DRAFT_1384421 [Armillaria luteobubalina]|uniref:Uncharacterized protein n=1 Tax=Armillaria luteobubalina TaxID=153913 RepID=A0AA39Q760_9AGAR|nr:hypothetical protein EDD18DRAFT_1384421 [Armillaria luteobubalina]
MLCTARTFLNVSNIVAYSKLPEDAGLGRSSCHGHDVVSKKVTEFEHLREDVRGFGDEPKAKGVKFSPLLSGMGKLIGYGLKSEAPTLPATELGVSPSTTPSAPVLPRPVQVKPLESFRDRWGQDTKHLWAREFWHRALRSEELIKIVYQAVFPPDEVVTDKDKYEMELGEGLVSIVICILWYPR